MGASYGKLANHLDLIVVDSSPANDNSFAFLSMSKVARLGIYSGDYVLLQGRNGRDTVANVRFFYEGWGLDNFLNFPFSDTVMMSRLVQDNLRVRPGDMVTITPIISMRQGTRVVILPFEGQEGPLRNLADGYLTAHFSRGYRPIHRGDAFTAIGSGPVPGRTMDFKVMDIETDAGPADYCYVGPETTIHCEGDPVKREDVEEATAPEEEAGGFFGICTILQ